MEREPPPQSWRAPRRTRDQCPRRGDCPGRISLSITTARAAAGTPASAASFGATPYRQRCPEAEPSPTTQRTRIRLRGHCPCRDNGPGRSSVSFTSTAARAAACLLAHAASCGASENCRRSPAAKPSQTLPRSLSRDDGSRKPAVSLMGRQGSGAYSGTTPGLPSSRARIHWI